MTNKIIKSNLFEAKVTEKTKWIFVKLENDIGVAGWGEATLQGKEKEIFSNSQRIFELILNKNYLLPQDIKKQIPFNNIIESAISSAIMQCLWDIEGKLKKKSICSMFGNNHEKISTYANFNRSTVDRTPNGIVNKLQEVIKDGFTKIKFAPFDEVSIGLTSKEIRKAMQPGLERITKIKQTVDPEVDIMIDCHWKFNFETTIDLIKEIESLNLYWLECPIPETIESIEELKKIRSVTNSKGMVLAGLEKKVLVQGFESYVKSGVYDIMMPDIKYAGGPDELIALEKFFNKYNVKFSPHNPTGPIAHAHTLQICGATDKPALMEYQYKETEFFKTLLQSSNPDIINGKSELPKHDFGVGVTVNEIELNKFN